MERPDGQGGDDEPDRGEKWRGQMDKGEIQGQMREVERPDGQGGDTRPDRGEKWRGQMDKGEIQCQIEERNGEAR